MIEELALCMYAYEMLLKNDWLVLQRRLVNGEGFSSSVINVAQKLNLKFPLVEHYEFQETVIGLTVLGPRGLWFVPFWVKVKTGSACVYVDRCSRIPEQVAIGLGQLRTIVAVAIVHGARAFVGMNMTKECKINAVFLEQRLQFSSELDFTTMVIIARVHRPVRICNHKWRA